MSDRARILVKIRAYDVDTLPVSLLVIRNLTDDGNADSWTCPLYIISRVMLGGGAGMTTLYHPMEETHTLL
jgi:hypothetical protein